MDEAPVPLVLARLADILRHVLDMRTRVLLSAEDGCPPCRCAPAALEAALTEMVRRVRDATPSHGTLLLGARSSEKPPRNAVIAPTAVSDRWVAISVGSDSAQSLDLDWRPVAPPHTDLALFARHWGAALSLQHAEREGLHLVLHLPCAGTATRERQEHARNHAHNG